MKERVVENPCEDPVSGRCLEDEARAQKQEIGVPLDFVQVQVRKIKAFEMIADALQTMAKVQSERYAKEFPPERDPLPAVIGRASDDQAQQFSDKPTDEWMRETEAALPERSRFAGRLEAAEKSRKDAEKSGSTTQVPKK